MKKIITLVLTSLLIFSLVSCSDNQNEKNKTATLKIVCHEVLENLESEDYRISDEKLEIVPENGVIYSGKASFADGESAYDVLKSTLMENKIHFDESDAYFKAIGNIYAGDCGANSGWMFYLNGELSEVGCNDYVLCQDDEIVFTYVVDYMKLFE